MQGNVDECDCLRSLADKERKLLEIKAWKRCEVPIRITVLVCEYVSSAEFGCELIVHSYENAVVKEQQSFLRRDYQFVLCVFHHGVDELVSQIDAQLQLVILGAELPCFWLEFEEVDETIALVIPFRPFEALVLGEVHLFSQRLRVRVIGLVISVCCFKAHPELEGGVILVAVAAA